MKSSSNFKFAIFCASLSATLSSHAYIIINEIDYDQPGGDTAEFIELYNNGNSTLSLNDHYLELINGYNDSVYSTINLTGFNINSSGYFVVCNDASLVLNCNYDITKSGGWIQNGAPDAIALFDSSGLLDSLAYEGEIASFTETTAPEDFDSNTFITSLSRFPDGLDTNNNGQDFSLGCITPGTANIAGSGDCSSYSSAASAVPAPATIWLLATGLIGMLSVSRKKM